MRVFLFAAIGFVALILWLAFAGRLFRARPAAAPAEIYMGLRNQALLAPREKFAIPTPARADEPWGLVMDWGTANGTATTVAMADGHASIYLSSGGGFLGGSVHKEVSDAAQKCVRLAAQMAAHFKPATDFPLPSTGEVIFYVRTDSGVRTASVSESELRAGAHPLSALGDAFQELITAYRVQTQSQTR